MVFGYACLLDMVVRGREERVFRKAFDTFCPVGPCIATDIDPVTVGIARDNVRNHFPDPTNGVPVNRTLGLVRAKGDGKGPRAGHATMTVRNMPISIW